MLLTTILFLEEIKFIRFIIELVYNFSVLCDVAPNRQSYCRFWIFKYLVIIFRSH